MFWLTDAQSKEKIAINPEYVVAVFKAPDGDLKGKTIVSLINGQVAVEEDDLFIVGQVEAV